MKSGKTSRPPQAIHGDLAKGKATADLEDLSIDDILAALKKDQPSLAFNRKERVGEFDDEDAEMAIELEWNRKHLECRFYGEARTLMDRVVAVMTRLGIPCYDAGAGWRFTVEEPPRYMGTLEEEKIEAELGHVLEEEKAKIEAATPDRSEQVRQLTAFLKFGGMKRAREEAVRRVQARKAKWPGAVRLRSIAATTRSAAHSNLITHVMGKVPAGCACLDRCSSQPLPILQGGSMLDLATRFG